MPLVDVIRDIQAGHDALYAERRAVCLDCEFHVLKPDGRLRCRHCHCEDPARRRPRCPLGLWGITPIAACANYRDGDRCELGRHNCNGCEDRTPPASSLQPTA